MILDTKILLLFTWILLVNIMNSKSWLYWLNVKVINNRKML